MGDTYGQLIDLGYDPTDLDGAAERAADQAELKALHEKALREQWSILARDCPYVVEAILAKSRVWNGEFNPNAQVNSYQQGAQSVGRFVLGAIQKVAPTSPLLISRFNGS